MMIFQSIVNTGMASTDSGYTDLELEESQAIPINKVLDNLYIGNVHSRQYLKEYKINHIIRLATEEEVSSTLDCPPIGALNVSETIYFISDSPVSKITPIIRQAVAVIEEVRTRGGVVLIHCQQGVSRSSAVVIGYLMKSKNISAIDALELLEKCRPCVWPNNGFWRELLVI